MSNSKRPPVIAITVLLFLGLIDAWAGRRSYVAGDTVTYMDMASGMASGDFAYAINGHFSPLYPAILAVFTWPFQSSSVLEFSIVRAVNFLLFATTIGVFHVFLSRFLDQHDRLFALAGDSSPAVSRSQFTIIAYALLAWGCFKLTYVSRINPDICVAAMTFAAAAIVLSFSDGQVSRAKFALFGFVLGVGYLFKAIFLPVSLLFMVGAAFQPQVWAVRKRLLLSLATFLLVACPLAVALSMKYGQPTFGNSGKASYWWEVLKQNPGYVHWQGEPPSSGTPRHPTRKVLDNPPVFEFASPIVATYPPWYDPTYWNAGADARIDIRRQATAIAENVIRLAGIVSATTAPVVLFLLVGFRFFGISVASFRCFWPLWLVAMGNLGLYVLINVEARYLAGCLPLLALLALAAVRVRTPKFARTAGTVLVALFVSSVALQCIPRLAQALAVIVDTGGDVRDDRWLVAQEFERLGIAAGTPVAAVVAVDRREDGGLWPAALVSDWARLARVRVVAEIPHADDARLQYWNSPPARQEAVLQALRRTGARIAVASFVPEGANTTGWTRIRQSRFYYRFLE